MRRFDHRRIYCNCSEIVHDTNFSDLILFFINLILPSDNKSWCRQRQRKSHFLCQKKHTSSPKVTVIDDKQNFTFKDLRPRSNCIISNLNQILMQNKSVLIILFSQIKHAWPAICLLYFGNAIYYYFSIKVLQRQYDTF